MKSLFVVIIIIIILLTFLNSDENIYKKYNYFDANGTTPIHPKALTAYKKSSYLGNPSSGYSSASFRILDAESKVRNRLNLPEDYSVIFNSGASEGNNCILRSLAGSARPHFILSSVEHKTSIKCAKCLEAANLIELSFVEPDIYGEIHTADISAAIQSNTKLISIMHVNNETGAKNDINAIAALTKGTNILFHTDAVQSFGKYIINMTNIDALTVSFHKLYGPAGVGMLVISPKMKNNKLDQISGSQFNGIRGGTENTPGIISSGVCMDITFKNRFAKNDKLFKLKKILINCLLSCSALIPYSMFAGKSDTYIPSDISGANLGLVILGPVNAAPNTLLMSIVRLGNYEMKDRICNLKIKEYLFARKFIISIGSACNTSDPNPSHVMKAIKAPFIIRSSVIRVSFMDYNTVTQTKNLGRCICGAINDQLIKFPL